MFDWLLFPLFFHLPALVICGAFFLAGRRTTHPRMAKTLKTSAIVWLVGLWVYFTGFWIATEACDGGVFYGFHSCNVISSRVAKAATAGSLIGIVAGAIYGILLTIVATVIETRHRDHHEP